MKYCTSRAFGFHWCSHIYHCHGCSLTLGWLVSYSSWSCECKKCHPSTHRHLILVTRSADTPHLTREWGHAACLVLATLGHCCLVCLYLTQILHPVFFLSTWWGQGIFLYLVSRKWGSEFNFFPLKEVSCWATKSTLAAAASPPLSSPPPVMVKIKQCSWGKWAGERPRWVSPSHEGPWQVRDKDG